MKQGIKLLGVLLITLVIHLFVHISGAVPFFDFRFFDLLSKNSRVPFDRSNSATVVVEIDEKSLQRYGQWPWPRLLLAKALEEIQRQRPAAVGLDVFFPEPDRTSPRQFLAFYERMLDLEVGLTGLPSELADHDEIFAHAMRSGPTVLPLFAAQSKTAFAGCDLRSADLLPLPPGVALPMIPKLLCNTKTLQKAARGFGYINASVDADGVFRRQPLFMNYQDAALPNLAIAMLRQVDPGLTIEPSPGAFLPPTVAFVDHKIPMDSHGEVLNLLYPEKAFNRLSMADLLSGNLPPGVFTGKLVLVGSTAAGLYDQYVAPGGEIIPGIYVHAALLENIMHQRVLYQPGATRQGALTFSFICSLLVVWLVFERHYLTSWIIYLGVVTMALGIAWVQLQQGLYISVGYFLTPFSLLFFIISLFFAVLHYIERKLFLEDLGRAHSATIDSMMMVAESRDVETGSHILRTKEYVWLLAEHLRHHPDYGKLLNPSVLELLYKAAPLHDIGKVGIPDAILRKPARLDEHEIGIMQKHVDIGQKIIENAINSYNRTNEFLTIASNIAYSHHEKWDGSGYPLGLQGQEIPLEARLMALADVYDALISSRYYKKPFSFEEAEEIIQDSRGKHFDPVVTDLFMALRHEFRGIARKHVESSGSLG